MTNYERIKAMSVEEMAEFLEYNGCNCRECDISPTLQKRIIATIEQYLDEKHEELNQI